MFADIPEQGLVIEPSAGLSDITVLILVFLIQEFNLRTPN